MKTMEIFGVHYKEKKTPKNWASLPDRACSACYLHRTKKCSLAIDGLAEFAFGGDCDKNDVVYVPATKKDLSVLLKETGNT